MTLTRRGVAVATAAALAFASVTPTAHADEARVQCDGVNSCKGTSACATASNACAHQNSCRGKGFLMLKPADCAAAKAKAAKPK